MCSLVSYHVMHDCELRSSQGNYTVAFQNSANLLNFDMEKYSVHTYAGMCCISDSEA